MEHRDDDNAAVGRTWSWRKGDPVYSVENMPICEPVYTKGEALGRRTVNGEYVHDVVRVPHYSGSGKGVGYGPFPAMPEDPGQMPSVALWTHTLQLGGAEKHTVDLACGLQARGFEVKGLGCMETMAEADHGLLSRITDAGIPVVKGYPEADVVLFWGTPARFPRAPCICIRHNGTGPWAPWAEHVVFVGPGGIPNGVEVLQNVYTPRMPGDPFTVGMLGRYSPEKRIDLAIDAMARLPERFRLVSAGPVHGWSDGRSAVEAQAERHGLNGRVELRGTCVPADLFRDVDCLLNCSDTEGLPMAVLEAAGAGIPVIHTGAGTLSEALPPDMAVHCGQSPEAIAIAIDALESHPSAGLVCSRNARQHVADKYSQASMLDGFAALAWHAHNTEVTR